MNYKSYFPIFQSNPTLKYFDHAASSLTPQVVIDALNDFYANNGVNIHRGVYQLASIATTQYENSRQAVANFINCQVDEVIFTSGTSHSINMLVDMLLPNLAPGDEIITCQTEHHSSILPLLMGAKKYDLQLKYVPLDADFKVTLANFNKVISTKTKLVCLAYVSNTFGYLLPAKEIIQTAHEVGAKVILDCAQSVSHIKLDVQDLDVDFVAFSAHKMYGPFGVGVLYGKKQLLSNLDPVEFGGEMVFKVADTPIFKDAPYRFETGTPNVAGVIALKSAIDFINEIGFDQVSEHEHKLHQYALAKLQAIPQVKIHNPKSDSPIILFNVLDVHPHDIASFLDSKNICVRAGHHCAQHTLALIEDIASLRVSFGIYNTLDDIDALVLAIKSAIDFFGGF